MEEGLTPAGPGPLARRTERAEQRLRRIAYGAFAAIILAGAVLIWNRIRTEEHLEVIGQTYALRSVSMRRDASTDAAPVKDLRPSEIVSITGYTHDMGGSRWFRVRAEDINGYLPARDVAPPKSTDPEKGFEILRHSLMALDDPQVLAQADQAIDLYHATFPQSSHYEELQWLVAEKTRELAAGRSPEMIGSARKIYENLAAGKGEFADRAKDSLSQLPTAPTSPERKAPKQQVSTAEMDLATGPTSPGPGGRVDLSAPVRRVTVVSRMPLFIRLIQSAKVTPGAVIQGEFANDVRVSQEVAVPRGSAAVVMVTQGNNAKKIDSLLLTGATIRGETYTLTASSRAIEIPSMGNLSASKQLPTTLPTGTVVEFRLLSDLVIRQR